MGQIIQEVVIWEEFIEEVFSIFFKSYSEGTSSARKKELDHLKIKDIEVHIYSVIDKVSQRIKERGIHN